MTASQILDWLSSHAGALWPVVSALLIIALSAFVVGVLLRVLDPVLRKIGERIANRK